jgi:PleD family two-component response regulator
MQVTCSHCNKRLEIPDEKLPTDRQVRIGCPSCRQHFTFAPYDPEATAASTSPAAQAAPPRAAVREGFDFNDLNIDISEMGQPPRALICLDTPSHRSECEGILPSLGFATVHAMSNQVQALAYLTQVPYNFVILDATFDGAMAAANPVLACIHELAIDQRRNMFVVLCTEDAETANAMRAYSQSVNLVVNHNDVLTCRQVLEQRLNEYQRLYRVYNETLQALGLD